MKTLKLCIIFFTISFTLLSPATKADNQDSFIKGSSPFNLIKDVKREAEAWATCAATYEITSQMYAKDKPATSKQLHQHANGSKLSILMAIALKSHHEISSKELTSLWEYGQLQVESLPDIQETAILALLEQAEDKKGQDDWLGKLAKTLDICNENAEGQQMYVDAWRELAPHLVQSE